MRSVSSHKSIALPFDTRGTHLQFLFLPVGQIFAECLLEMNDKDKEQARVVMDHLKRRLLGPVKFHNYFKDVADTLHVLVATYGRDENNPHPLVKKAIYATRAVQNYEGLPEWMGRLDLHGAISNALGLDEVDNLSEVTAHAVRTKSAAVE